MSYKSFKKVLDGGLIGMKASLPTYFSSADFIKVAKECFPNEYATLLQNSNYRTLHSWIARWYLNQRFVKHTTKDVISPMGNKSKNKTWEK